MKRTVPLFACVAMCLALAGCEFPGAVAEVVAPSKVPAVYPLADRVTLMLIDDPGNRLGNVNLTDQIASVAEYELRQNKVVTRFVPLKDLHRLASQTGSRFATMPLQEIGKRLNADQVVHVHVEQVDVQEHPGVMRPQALLLVKVLDVETGRRLFPAQVHAASGASAGHPIKSEMRQSIRPADSTAERVVLFNRFADHLGSDIAKVFYDHLPPQPGKLAEELRDSR